MRREHTDCSTRGRAMHSNVDQPPMVASWDPRPVVHHMLQSCECVCVVEPIKARIARVNDDEEVRYILMDNGEGDDETGDRVVLRE